MPEPGARSSSPRAEHAGGSGVPLGRLSTAAGLARNSTFNGAEPASEV
jgi:hypothetical protein